MRPGRFLRASRPARGALALCAAGLLALPGCGSSDDDKGTPIPAQQANQMIALLEQANRQNSQGTCNGADAKVRQAQGVLDTLPRSVDRDVRQGLADGMNNLRELIASECERPQQTETETTKTETVTTPTETTPTETTPTETTPTETTPTETTPTETTPTETTPTPPPTPTTGNGGTGPPSDNG